MRPIYLLYIALSSRTVIQRQRKQIIFRNINRTKTRNTKKKIEETLFKQSHNSLRAPSIKLTSLDVIRRQNDVQLLPGASCSNTYIYISEKIHFDFFFRQLFAESFSPNIYKFFFFDINVSEFV